LQHREGEGFASFAETRVPCAGNGQSLLVGPGLNPAHGTGARTVLTGDLSQKRPKYEGLWIVPDASGFALLFKNFRVDFVAELLGNIKHVSFANSVAFLGEKVLIFTGGTATKIRGEAGDEGSVLFHTKDYLIAGFSTLPIKKI
jgi:hypothetical protein